MMFLFPLLTIITSLGYWGGANLFPAGLSIFWTIQSIFVIMQQSMTNKEKTIQWLKGKFFSRKSKEDV
jgi:membrane protein insertase Oxa1/YidC/SpoIIIJ